MITNLKIKDFRQFKNYSIQLTSKYVAITGPNGIGKTTILEAISLLSITKSHRSSNLRDFIRYDQEFAVMEAETKNGVYRMVITPSGKTISVDGLEVEKLSTYIGKFPSVFFSPNDLDLVYGPPSGRRKLMNQEISQIRPVYLHNLNTFHDLLLERNTFLKTNDNPAFLDVLTKQLIDVQEQIIPIREKFIKELNNIASDIFKQLSINHTLEIKYLRSLPEVNLLDFYRQKLTHDLQSTQTNYGVHRDDLQFLIDNQEAFKFASQGQIRLLVLSIKIAMVKIIYKFRNAYPVLLLDDVLSELDNDRQRQLLNIILDLGQVFITSTSFKIDNNISKKFQQIKLSKEQ